MRLNWANVAMLSCLIVNPSWAEELPSSVDPSGLHRSKTTPLALYLTPNDAHSALSADPSIVYVDVRDPVEIAFVGRAEGLDAIVPLNLVGPFFDHKRGGLTIKRNPNFVSQVDRIMAREGKTKADPLIVSCRSGGRSAAAVKLLAAAGYSQVYNQIEGFEGDWNKSTGARDRNGWRNANLPWSMALNARIAWQP